MKVSYNWLQDYFTETLPGPEVVARELTFKSFEIEELAKRGGDWIFDVQILPNRAHDCLSQRGIAKEISVIFSLPLKDDPLRRPLFPLLESSMLSVTIDDSHLCERYIGAVIRGVRVEPSPRWLKERLESIGQRSINTVVDATNYVMYDLGQPLHAFDAARLAQSKEHWTITVRNAKTHEEFRALGGADYILTPDTLVIGDDTSGGILGIAGVKGGTAAEITNVTKDIIIESAHFNPVSIRKTAQRQKLWTDASQRFQNNPSPELAGYAVRQVVDLILKMAGGDLEGIVDDYPGRQRAETVAVSVEEVNALLGTSLEAKEVMDILQRFCFTVASKREHGANVRFVVDIPFERLDLRIKEDLIEEIGRIYGYEKISKNALPAANAKPAINKRYAYAGVVRDSLIARGFSEIVTSSFCSEGTVEIENPLTADKRFLRSTLFENMRAALDLNIRNTELLGLDQIKIFEIGTTFNTDGEKLMLALGVRNASGYKKLKEADALVDGIHAVGEALGSDLEETEPLPQGIFELDLGSFIDDLPDRDSYEAVRPSDVRYTPISSYPFLIRDIAVFVPHEGDREALERIIKAQGTELLVYMRPFDTFTKTFPDGSKKTSYAYRLIFQSTNRTLTDEEAAKIMEALTAALAIHDGWQVR